MFLIFTSRVLPKGLVTIVQLEFCVYTYTISPQRSNRCRKNLHPEQVAQKETSSIVQLGWSVLTWQTFIEGYIFGKKFVNSNLQSSMGCFVCVGNNRGWPIWGCQIPIIAQDWGHPVLKNVLPCLCTCLAFYSYFMAKKRVKFVNTDRRDLYIYYEIRIGTEDLLSFFMPFMLQYNLHWTILCRFFNNKKEYKIDI
jgi:hypothetical protein